MINHHIQLQLLKQAVLKSGCCKGTSWCSVHANDWSVHSNVHAQSKALCSAACMKSYRGGAHSDVHAKSAWCVGCWARTALHQRTNAPVHEWDELAKGGCIAGVHCWVHFFGTSQCMVRGRSTSAEDAHDQKFAMCWAFKMRWSTHGIIKCRRGIEKSLKQGTSQCDIIQKGLVRRKTCTGNVRAETIRGVGREWRSAHAFIRAVMKGRHRRGCILCGASQRSMHPKSRRTVEQQNVRSKFMLDLARCPKDQSME